MLDHVQDLGREARARLDGMADEAALDAWHSAYLGKRGRLTQTLRAVGGLPLEQRAEVGRAANELKRDLTSLWEARRDQLAHEQERDPSRQEAIDVTLPGRPLPLGGLHPVSRTLREMKAVFAQMGFQVAEGPEIEEDLYNFTLLNMPPFHPARDAHDTFYTTTPGLLLRTHTSPNQVRLMRHMQPPIRMVVPGKVYRYENVDPSHDWMFYQMEGLVVGRNIAMRDLLGTIREFARRVFGPERHIRFRCDYFPYVEPGLDTAVSCMLCDGAGCRLCSGTGWLEAIPGGMIHPQVLRNCGIDPQRYAGFAFGAGPDRITALKYGVDDIRRFFGNDLRFLDQFH